MWRDRIQNTLVFYGNKQAGMVGLLTAKILTDVIEIWTDDCIPGALGRAKIIRDFPETTADILLCVHGRRIIPVDVLDQFDRAINVHPFLEKYPGADPVGRAIAAGESEASVCAHYMTGTVDSGQIITKVTAPMPENPTRESVYNVLYPLYVEAVARAVVMC